MDIHQDDETSDKSLEGMGHQNSYLYRRYIDTVKIQGGGSATPESAGIPPRSSQRGKIYSATISGAGVHRAVGRFTEPPAQATHQKGEVDPQGAASMEGNHISTSAFPVPIKIECSFASNTGSPPNPVLKESTRRPTEDTALGRPELRSSLGTIYRGPRRS